MTKFYEINEHQFEAEITIHPLGPTTRNTHPYNGIRWSFAYADDWDNGSHAISDVWPEFIDEIGNSISDDIPLSGKLKARMYIISREMILVHLNRIEIGTKFYCTEGSRSCATGTVTAI